jgi:hypothetical protein
MPVPRSFDDLVAEAALDDETGGGEVLAGVPALPPLMAATESWPPNVTPGPIRLGDPVTLIAADLAGREVAPPLGI